MTSPIKSCAGSGLDVSTAHEFVDLLLPYVTCMVNSSLRDAWVPDLQKHAVITSLLKQPGLDTMDMANYRKKIIENHRACSGQATSPVPDRQRVVTALSVSLSPSSLDGNSYVAHPFWLINSHWCKPSNATRSTWPVHEVQVLSSTIKIDSSANNLGVVVDSRLTMSDHVSSVFCSAYYYLRQIRPIAQSLTIDAARTLVQAFIASRLDYCNAVLHGITDNLLQWLHSVQNAAARLVTRTGWFKRVTPVLRNYIGCWCDAVSEFKIATLSVKALNGWTWLTIATWSVKTLADYVQPPLSLVLYWGQGHGSVTDHSQSPAHESGTVCQLHCGSSNNSKCN